MELLKIIGYTIIFILACIFIFRFNEFMFKEFFGQDYFDTSENKKRHYDYEEEDFL